MSEAAEQMHAIAYDALSGLSICSLVVKGPSTAQLLYPDSTRTYADADVLVSPGDFERALAGLLAVGFRSLEAGLRVDERSTHAETLVCSGNSSSLDLHRRIPGMRADPTVQWAALWRDRRSLQLHGLDLAVPSKGACALIVALHAALSGYGISQSSMDLRRALVRLDEDTWRQAFELADATQSTDGLVAGLRFLPEGRALSSRHAPSVSVGEEWLVLQLPDRGPVQRLALARTLPVGARFRLLLREIFPSRAFMRKVAGERLRGRRLAWAYLGRWVSLIRRLPRAIKASHRVHRAARQLGESAPPKRDS